MTTFMPWKARALAVEAHGSQKYGSRPYSDHLDEVAALCTMHGKDAQTVAYLHDVLEDTNLLVSTLRETIGGYLTECVELLTDPPGANRKERKAALYETLYGLHVSRQVVLVVKAADRLANVRACVRDKNQRLFEMYKREHGDFRRAVHRYGLNDAFFEELDAFESVGGIFMARSQGCG